jgi:hypothetical protein
MASLARGPIYAGMGLDDRVMIIFLGQEKLAIAEEMKERGNASFKRGDYYDALWKYEHSCLVLDALKEDGDASLAVVYSNMSVSCLKLGDDERVDLLHSPEGIPIHQIMWYGFAHRHAHQALSKEPLDPKIAWKVRQWFFKLIIGGKSESPKWNC